MGAKADRMARIELIQAMQERLTRAARVNLFRFTLATMPSFRPADFHRRYYERLDEFAHGRIKKLMVFVPPQHGKSEGSTRRLPAFVLGQDPHRRIAIVSYSAPKARKFNREIQRIIDTPEYAEIFPGTRLNSSNVTTVAGAWLRNAEECEIVGCRGGFKAVGVGGPLTGDPVDMLIMDDLYKDAKSAWSPAVRESVSDWYDTVAETRLHNDSQQLLVFTRWHEDDLAGKLIREQGVYDASTNPTGWVVVIYQAIKVGAPTEYDPRNEGEALWPERQGLEKLEAVRERAPHVFDSLYQQDPKPLEGLMYSYGFRTYEVIPRGRYNIRKAYIDTADTGSDYLCAIFYEETDLGNYVLDIIYTQKPMEVTEPLTAEMIAKYKPATCYIESNNGGRGFARKVEELARQLGNATTRFVAFHQSENKHSRIYTSSASVQNMTFFPAGWERTFPAFSSALGGYLKAGDNAHDDAPDALTGAYEKRERARRSSAASVFGG